MDLRQLQFSYDALQDRLLMRATFFAPGQAPHDAMAWLTRRLVRELWPRIEKAVATQLALDRPQAALAQQDAVSKFSTGSASRPIRDEVRDFPVSKEPFVVAAAHFTLESGQPLRIHFVPEVGKGFEIAFPPNLLQGFCKLLQEGSVQSEWDLGLKMSWLADRPPAPRTLN